MNPSSRSAPNTGFTLIELSIVLVIIGLIVGGLIVGGILVGRDLISAAYVRAQISQIEKFQTAKNTFLGKYGQLPGDIQPQYVTQFGFSVVPARAGTTGQGNGNGIMEGYGFASSAVYQWVNSGENAWFWEDLSSNTTLISGGFNSVGANGTFFAPGTTNSRIGLVIPNAVAGNGNYVYVYSYNNINYFGVSAITYLDGNGAPYGNPGLTVAQAYAMDNKTDDGYPQTGRVTAMYQDILLNNGIPTWSGGPGVNGPSGTVGTSGTSSTCYDNGGTGGATQQYSMEQNGGTGVNCGLSFQFQ